MPPNNCNHEKYIKYGRRKTSFGWKQTYKCKTCNKRFVKPWFKWIHFKPKTVLQALSQYAKGLTLREIATELHKPKSHVTIWNWITKYAQTIYRFTRNRQPNRCFQLHVDELFLRMKKRFYYLFDSIDAITRFAVFNLETSRNFYDSKRLFEQSPKPEYIVSDGLLSCQQYLRKAYSYKWLRQKYYRHHTFKSKHNNNLVERLQSTLRRWLHPKRGFKSLASGRTMLKFYYVFYNFIRKHSSIGMTPAEKAGVIKYKNKDKWLELIKQAHFSYFSNLTTRFLNRTCNKKL